MSILKPMCEICPMRRRAEKAPNSFMARIWRWHTSWCPGYKMFTKNRQATAK